MDQFKLVLWALFFTLFIPLLLWTSLFAIFGWKLFLVLFGVIGIGFLLRDRIFKSSLFQGLLQMLIPFALTFRFYDALRAGKEKQQEQGNLFQVLWASSRGFLKGEEKDSANEDIEEAPKARVQQAKRKAALEEAEAKAEAEAAFAKLDPSATEPPPPPAPAPRKSKDPEEIDAMLTQLKQKMAKDKERVKQPVPESSQERD